MVIEIETQIISPCLDEVDWVNQVLTNRNLEQQNNISSLERMIENYLIQFD